jgi:transposase
LDTTFKDIDSDELDALMIKRVTEAQRHELALSSEDLQLLLDALLTLTTMQDNLTNQDVTIGKLRKLLGIVRSSESLDQQLTNKKKFSRNKRNKPDTPAVKPQIKKHQLTHVCKGQECQEGKLYKFEPATFLRFTGQTPFVPEQHVMERLRCNTCGAYFTAPLPEDVQTDGDARQKYGYSARSIMAVAKFFAGTPYYRQGSLQDMLGVSISASKLFDQVERVAVCRYLLNILAADAVHFYMDDTTNRIINQQPVTKTNRNGKGVSTRAGVYTSGTIAQQRPAGGLVSNQCGSCWRVS